MYPIEDSEDSAAVLDIIGSDFASIGVLFRFDIFEEYRPDFQQPI